MAAVGDAVQQPLAVAAELDDAYLAGVDDHLAAVWRDNPGEAAEAPPVAGHVIAATENGSLYSLEGTTGRIRWRRHLADPVPASALPCGNIDPVGITGTPVYDPTTGGCRDGLQVGADYLQGEWDGGTLLRKWEQQQRRGEQDLPEELRVVEPERPADQLAL